MDSIDNKGKAQALINQINAFRDELTRLKKVSGFSLSQDAEKTAFTEQDAVIHELQRKFLVDVNVSEARLSLGIRVASALGAIALSLAVYFLFSEFWDKFPTALRAGVATAAPIISVLATFFVMSRDRTGYFGSIFGLLTFCLIILNLVLLGNTFVLPSSPRAFLVWGATGLILAYAFGFRLLLYAGLLSLLGYLSAEVGTWSGCYWLDFGEKPENFILAGVLITAGFKIPSKGEYSSFPVAYKVIGLLTLFFSILTLSNWGASSYLPWEIKSIENFYQIIGFLLWGAVIFFGVRRDDSYFANMGIVFFTIQLYTKAYDWFWNWMPKYLFFFLVFLIFLFALLVLSRLRKYRIERTAT